MRIVVVVSAVMPLMHPSPSLVSTMAPQPRSSQAFSQMGISRYAQGAASKKRRISHLRASAAGEEEPRGVSREELQKLTVKLLRERLKLIEPPIKTSQLKLKEDMVDCLLQHYFSNCTAPDDRVQTTPPAMATAVTHSHSNRTRAPPPRLVRMPSILTDTSLSAPTLSPKDAIFEQVFTRYPPLRELHSLQQPTQAKQPSYLLSSFTHPSAFRSLSGLGELDIRQTFHPILSNTTNSDFDVVMVGTASCVPGVTRGVSCTALRMQWRRTAESITKNFHDTTGNYGPNYYLNTPGTWIFDCGESTQVGYIRFYIQYSISQFNLELELD